MKFRWGDLKFYNKEVKNMNLMKRADMQCLLKFLTITKYSITFVLICLGALYGNSIVLCSPT